MPPPFDNNPASLAGSITVPLEGFKKALPLLCESGCDRLPLRVRNLPVPFYLAGFDDSHVFLSHADTCLISAFTYDALELPSLATFEQLPALILEWMGTTAGIAASELVTHAHTAATAGVSIPVVLRWPDGDHRREGTLTITSNVKCGKGAQWVAAVEACEGQDVVFRYGLSRIGTAMHDGKLLTMRLLPGTCF